MAFDSVCDPADIQQKANNGRYISTLMLLVWNSRKDLQQAFDLSTAKGQDAFISWYQIFAPAEYALEPGCYLPGGKVDGLNQTSDRHAGALRYFGNMLARASQILPSSFRHSGRRVWLRLMVALAARKVRHQAPAAAATSTDVLPANAPCPVSEPKPGLLLIGNVRADLGQGEYVRMSARTLATTDIPHGIFNYRAVAAARQGADFNDVGADARQDNFQVNLFHINADQILPALGNLGLEFFHQKVNICAPFWELEKCPTHWIPYLQMMDDVWAPTQYIQKSLSEALGREVPYIPAGMSIPDKMNLSRAELGLPDHVYLFFFSFDFFSFIDRKNPFAIIRAFKKAFPTGREAVGLVIKVMNANDRDAKWQEMLALIDGDHRVLVINETMDKPRLLGLEAACDCYVSLHRAEGLGLGPLEAMLLGKPVIATNYSGNLDYCKPEHSCLVNYELVPVREGQYPFYEGQVWADPDEAHAAWHMRELVAHPDLGLAMGARAAAYVSQQYALEHCGKAYVKRLRAVFSRSRW